MSTYHADERSANSDESFSDWLAEWGIARAPDPLPVALAYAAAGVHILPLRGKRPDDQQAPHGVRSASCKPHVVEDWFSREPRPNVGIALGVGSLASVRVVDVDPRSGGLETIATIEAEHGALPSSLTTLSGRCDGGRHIYLRWPAGTYRGKLGPGIDLLGPGRYAVAPPSIHPETGGLYAWEDAGAPIGDAPVWLVKLATPLARSEPAAHEPIAAPAGDVMGRARRYLARVPGAVSGSGGHSHTFVVAQRLVRGFELAPDVALALLREWNARCEPPWGEGELRRKVRQAADRGTMAVGSMLKGVR